VIRNEPGVKWREHAIAPCGIRPIITKQLPPHLCPGWKAARPGQIPLETRKYGFGIYPVARLGLPTEFQYLPYTIREQFPFISLRPLGAFARQDLPNHNKTFTLGKWWLPAEDFVDHHPERVTIRFLGWTTLLQPELLWVEQLWAHPWNRSTL
jgi:hypothetical protein